MVYFKSLNKTQKQTPVPPKVMNLQEGARFESSINIFYQKSINQWRLFNGNNYPVSYVDNRITYLPLMELCDEEDYTTYSIQNIHLYDIMIDKDWVTLLSYNPNICPLPNPKQDEVSGLVEGNCNLKNITFTFDGQRWFFINKNIKVYFHSDILMTNIEGLDTGIQEGEQITFKEITGCLTSAGKYWIFVLHRKAKTQ